MKIHQKWWFHFLIILALIALNHFVFDLFFKTLYLNWYLKNGSLIGAVAALVTFAWDVNKHTGLISANPREYFASYLQLVGAQFISLGAFGKKQQRKSEEETYIQGIPFFDSLVFIVFAILIIVIFLLWIIVVVPVQYFFILILGGPGRIYLSSPVRSLARFRHTQLETKEIPWEEKKPDDWMDLSIANKPVSFTYALIALVLAVIKFFM
jgi:hypothetical protein